MKQVNNQWWVFDFGKKKLHQERVMAILCNIVYNMVLYVIPTAVCDTLSLCPVIFKLISRIDVLTHWGRVMHICVGKLTIIGSDYGLSPGRRHVIIWPNAGILLIGPLGTNFNEILIEIPTSSVKKIRLKMLSVKCCPFHLSLNVSSLSYEIDLMWMPQDLADN